MRLGTTTVKDVAVAAVIWALRSLIKTLLFAIVVLKPLPDIVRFAPGAGFTGENPVMIGAAEVVTVKFPGLYAMPPGAVTLT